MGIFRRLMTSPLAPLEGVVWLAEQMERQANDVLYGPRALRAELLEIDQAFERGELTWAERDLAEDEVLARFEHGRRTEGVLDGD
jgi:hypothetical protein